jgi:hypothetical protein
MTTPFTVPQGFTEASAPELFKFEKIGDQVEGILLKGKMEKIGGDEVLELYISTGRKVVRIRPGYDIRSKFNRGMLGKHVLIRYNGNDDSKGKTDPSTGAFNPMKVFGVYFKDAPAKGQADGDPGITDDDIPF